MAADSRIEAFLTGTHFAVAGASADRKKFGNKVLRCYQAHGLNVQAVTPRAKADPDMKIEGAVCVARLADLAPKPHGLSIITNPLVTEQLIAEAIAQDIQNVWMQPGAESRAAIELAEDAGLNAIYGGPCLLIELPTRES